MIFSIKGHLLHQIYSPYSPAHSWWILMCQPEQKKSPDSRMLLTHIKY